MAAPSAPSGGESPVVDAARPEERAAEPEQAASAPPAPPAPSPYDDMLCTICNLKACWMTPEAAGKAPSGS